MDIAPLIFSVLGCLGLGVVTLASLTVTIESKKIIDLLYTILSASVFLFCIFITIAMYRDIFNVS